MSKLNVFAVRNGNQVSVTYKSKTSYLTLKDDDEAKEWFKKIYRIKESGNEEELLKLTDPNYRIEHSNYLVKSLSGNYFLRGTNVPLPDKLMERINEFLEAELPIEPLINFWKLCLLNPNEQARDDLFKFMDTFKMPITDMGYFIAYKSVMAVSVRHREYVTRISNDYINMKAYRKKDPDDFKVFYVINKKDDEPMGDVHIVETSQLVEYMEDLYDEFYSPDYEAIQKYMAANHPDVYMNCGGDQYELADYWYDDLNNPRPDAAAVKKYFEDNYEVQDKGTLTEAFFSITDLLEEQQDTFTDWHTRKMTIRVGTPVKIDRGICDPDAERTCSVGLHVGSTEYVNGFGSGVNNFIIACLINPMNVTAVPVDYNFQKMRTCEYYPYAIVDNTGGKFEEIDTIYFENDYCTYEKEELERQLEKINADIEPSVVTGMTPEEQVALIKSRLITIG